MQFKQEEQQGSQAMDSPPQQASILHQYPVMGPRRWTGGGRPSSPGPALYDLHNNNSGSEGSQLSHGGASQAATTAAAVPANGDASSWEVRAFAEDSASCSGQWPPRSYACSFCRREFRTAQALGGHMNVHRRERAQANNMAILRSSAQQAAAAATGPPTPQLAAVGPQGQWCLYSPQIGVGVNADSIAASSERRAFFYSSLAPGGAIIAMTNSSGGSSQFTSSSSPSQYKKVAGSIENHNNNNGNAFCSTQIPSSRFSTSPDLSSPISQNSRSSGSSVVTKSGSGSKGEAGPYRSTSSASGDSPSCFAQKLQVGAFQPYQPSPFAHEAAPLVTQELIQLRPQHHTSTLLSKSMVIRGPTDDMGFLDLELRLGPA